MAISFAGALHLHKQNRTSLNMWFQHCSLVSFGTIDSTALIMACSLSVIKQQEELFREGIAFTAS